MPHLSAIGVALAAVLLAPAASTAPAEVLDVRELTAPAALTGLAPGDTTEWAAEVTNVGSTAHEVSVAFAVDGGDSLATDPRNGLQLEVDLCPSAFAIDRSVSPGRSIERYVCPGAVPLGAGPAASLGRLDGSRALAGGETVGVRVRVSFPEQAGNDLEDTVAALRVIVTDADPLDPAAPSDGLGPIAAPSDGLAVTGRDLGAALLGGLLALGAGGLLALAGRRRRQEQP